MKKLDTIDSWYQFLKIFFFITDEVAKQATMLVSDTNPLAYFAFFVSDEKNNDVDTRSQCFKPYFFFAHKYAK